MFGLEYSWQTRETKPGKKVSVTITSPFTISGDFLIQSVEMTPLGDVRPDAAGGVTWQYRVNARSVRQQDAVDLLIRR